MIFTLAALLMAAPQSNLEEAALALAADRTQQARQMIVKAVREGASGASVDRILADLAFAERRWPEASARYRALLTKGEVEPLLLERAGIAALHADQPDAAVPLLDRAVRLPRPSWRAWNARGVAADRQADWAAADQAYAQALLAAPDNAQVLNNHGWSLLLRGRWDEAVPALAKAAALAPASERIAANLDLARSALDANLPVRRRDESGASYAARLNDAGVVASRRGNRAKAAAAFAQALEASDRWFVRAANNLRMVEAR